MFAVGKQPRRRPHKPSRPRPKIHGHRDGVEEALKAAGRKPMRSGRREFLGTAGGALAAGAVGPQADASARGPMVPPKDGLYDVAVIGSGVFGSWTAGTSCAPAVRVALVDTYGPASSRGSSGGETRVTRMGYGPDEVYTRWSCEIARAVEGAVRPGRRSAPLPRDGRPVDGARAGPRCARDPGDAGQGRDPRTSASTAPTSRSGGRRSISGR